MGKRAPSQSGQNRPYATRHIGQKGRGVPRQDASPLFFLGLASISILSRDPDLSGKPPFETRSGKRIRLKRTMVEKNGRSLSLGCPFSDPLKVKNVEWVKFGNPTTLH